MINRPDTAIEPAARTVLVVEDEVLVRLLVAEALREAGLRVLEAGDADEALAFLRAGNWVDLVFSDVRMPGSMDGVELAQRVNREFPHLKVILTSGHLRDQDVRIASPVIAKPYDLDYVASLVRSILDLNKNSSE